LHACKGCAGQWRETMRPDLSAFGDDPFGQIKRHSLVLGALARKAEDQINMWRKTVL